MNGYALWTMANLAVHREGQLRDYYLRRRKQGMHYLSLITAVTIKLTHITWRILTDKRDYLRTPPARSL